MSGAGAGSDGRVRALGVIPARGGSKGIPGKNTRELWGKPLIAHTIEAARGARRLDRVIVTTDDPGIAEVARAWGGDAPFLRPAELGRDDTPTLPVLRHAVGFVEGEEGPGAYGAVVLLQPTAPGRTSEDIDACLDLWERTGADTVFSALEIPAEHHPDWAFVETGGEVGGGGCGAVWLRTATGSGEPPPRRQALRRAWHREGSIYVVGRDTLMEGNTLYGARMAAYPMDPRRSVDLNDPIDWERAERLGRGELANWDRRRPESGDLDRDRGWGWDSFGTSC